MKFTVLLWRSHELTPFPLSALQRGGYNDLIISNFPLIAKQRGGILSVVKEGGEFRGSKPCHLSTFIFYLLSFIF